MPCKDCEAVFRKDHYWISVLAAQRADQDLLEQEMLADPSLMGLRGIQAGIAYNNECAVEMARVRVRRTHPVCQIEQLVRAERDPELQQRIREAPTSLWALWLHGMRLHNGRDNDETLPRYDEHTPPAYEDPPAYDMSKDTAPSSDSDSSLEERGEQRFS